MSLWQVAVDFRCHSGDFATRKGAQNQSAQAAVARGLQLKHGVRFIGLPLCDMGWTFELVLAARVPNPGCSVSSAQPCELTAAGMA